MSGLPRSGNTLISCILNQNPEIKVSANSVISETLFRIHNIKETNIFQNFPDEKSLNNIIKNIFNNYYSKWDANIIIDRGPWGTPFNLNALRHYFPEFDIKVISPVRPFLEVLTSYYNQKSNYLDSIIDSWSFPLEKSRQEYKCEMIMEEEMIQMSLMSVKNLSKQDSNTVKFIDYHSLVSSPKNTIDNIYDFLKLEKYCHNFSNINQYSNNGIKYNDIVTGANNLHTIKTNIQASKTNINILSDKIISRYSHLDCWRNR